MREESQTLESLTVNGFVYRDGFFTRRHVLGDLTNDVELERRVGYQPGRLRFGWYVLSMMDRPPNYSEFAVAGYSHFSGGRVQGHKKDPKKRGMRVEDALRADGIDVDKVKRELSRGFAIDGPYRLIKIVPALKDTDEREASIQSGKYWHPNPSPVPQWVLTTQMKFLVEAHHKGSSG